MRIKQNGWVLGCYIITGVVATAAVGIGIASIVMSTNNFSHKTLSQKQVSKNFSEKGIWHNKKSITASDLSSYKYIDNNSFDIPNVTIESVELPYSLRLSDRSTAITWSSVQNIKVQAKQEQDGRENGWVIDNNVLYNVRLSLFGTYNYIYASTIANRLLKVDNIKLGEFDENNLPLWSSNYTLNISNNFYNPDLFKNIGTISISDYNADASNKMNVTISNIYSNAFKNCDKINSLELHNSNSLLDSTYIGPYAFYNSSISNVTITSNNLNVSVQKYAFGNCNKLSNIYVEGYTVDILNNAFASDSTTSLDSRKIIVYSKNENSSDSNAIENQIYNNAFSGNYKSLLLYLIYANPYVTNFQSKAFSGIQVNPTTELKINTNLKYDFLVQKGLDANLYNANNIKPLGGIEPTGAKNG